jgi:glycosyltransferase involved in cell wall biosynthesis
MVRAAQRVSVIIPTIGREVLRQCQSALARQTRTPDEVLVIHDTDRRGPAWARNEGLRRTHGDLVAFIDDDCVAPPDWLARLIHAVDRFEAAAAGGTFAETDLLLREVRSNRLYPQTEQLDTAGLVGNSGNIMFRRSWLEGCFERDGYVFNESYGTHASEDWELICRLRMAGATFAFVPNPVTHLKRMTPRSYCLHQFNRGIGLAKLFRFQRSRARGVTFQSSLLWCNGPMKQGSRWGTALWQKAIGPFDYGRFASPSRFAWYWAGAKFESFGFFWGLWKSRRDSLVTGATGFASAGPISSPERPHP